MRHILGSTSTLSTTLEVRSSDTKDARRDTLTSKSIKSNMATFVLSIIAVRFSGLAAIGVLRDRGGGPRGRRHNFIDDDLLSEFEHGILTFRFMRPSLYNLA